MGVRRGRIRRELDELKGAEPGRRFESGHDRHRVGNSVLRLTIIAIGLTMVTLGALTFWLPGPQIVVVLLGLALIAGQWRFIARTLDRGELGLRRVRSERWEPLSHRRKRAALGAAWFGFGSAVALVVVGAWSAGLLPTWLPLID